MRHVNSAKFRGKRWRLVSVPKGSTFEGKLFGPHVKGKQLLLSLGDGSRNEMETIIHESLHACFWDMDEEAVHESAHDIATFLWRLGWRLSPDGYSNKKRRKRSPK